MLSATRTAALTTVMLSATRTAALTTVMLSATRTSALTTQPALRLPTTTAGTLENS